MSGAISRLLNSLLHVFIHSHIFYTYYSFDLCIQRKINVLNLFCSSGCSLLFCNI
jgi:hypothetical protein